MNGANAFFAVLFTLLGVVLFVYRLLYMLFRGLSWNNQPSSWSWSATYFIFGTALLLTVIITPECGNKCSRDSNLFGLGLALAISAMVASTIAWLYTDLTKGKGFDAQTGKDLRPPMSGMDFVFIAVGLGVLLGDVMLGRCPSSC